MLPRRLKYSLSTPNTWNMFPPTFAPWWQETQP